MHVSRAVQTVRDDPVPGESIALVLETADEADVEGVADAAEDAGATVERRLQFDDLVVEVPQEDVSGVLELDGVAVIQTADAIGIHPEEAEEDVDPEALGDG